MKHIICAVRDAAADCFHRPIFVPTVAVAVRSFGDECKNKESALNVHPEHYELFELGCFDDYNAKFEMLDSPRSLSRAVDFMPRAEVRAIN